MGGVGMIGGGASILGLVETAAGGVVSDCTSVLGGVVPARSCDAIAACGAREGFAAGATSWNPRSSIGAVFRLANPRNCASVLRPARHSSSAASGRERRDVEDL